MFSASFATVILGAATVLPMTSEPEQREDKPKPLTVRVILKGVHCQECVKVLRSELARVKGLKFDKNKIQAGKKPKYFSDPILVQILDPKKTYIGLLGKAIAKAKTPHTDDVPPALHILIYTNQRIQEETVSAMRQTLRPVNGIEVDVNGGLGGMPKLRCFWIQLEAAGGAEIEEILEAAREQDPQIGLAPRKDTL